jgi:hypothetical protein
VFLWGACPLGHDIGAPVSAGVVRFHVFGGLNIYPITANPPVETWVQSPICPSGAAAIGMFPALGLVLGY